MLRMFFKIKNVVHLNCMFLKLHIFLEGGLEEEERSRLEEGCFFPICSCKPFLSGQW